VLIFLLRKTSGKKLQVNIVMHALKAQQSKEHGAKGLLATGNISCRSITVQQQTGCHTVL